MMGAPLVDAQRLAAWTGTGSFDAGSTDLSRAAEMISTVSDIVRGEARQNWAIMDVPPAVAAIVLMVSVALWENPDSKTSITIEEVTRRWERKELFSAAQLATLRSYRPGQSSGLASVQFTRGFDFPSIKLPTGDDLATPPQDRPSATARVSPVVGGPAAVMYDDRGF